MRVLTFTLAVAALGIVTSPLSARPSDHSGYHIYTPDEIGMIATPIEDVGGPAGTGPSVIYSSMGSFDAGWGTGLFSSLTDDYTSTAAPGLHKLYEFRFGGGVDVVGGVVFVDFFDGGGAPVDGFGIALPSAGNFIWTIFGFGDAVDIPDAGSVEVTEDSAGEFGPATSFTWFSSDLGALVGGNDFLPGLETGAAADTAFAFELTIPAPGALALLGVAGIIGGRRRRRNA